MDDRDDLKEFLTYFGTDEATTADRTRLTDKYNIRTIIDLRTKTEHIEQSRKRDEKLRALASSPEALPTPNDLPAEPLQIPGVLYRNINFNGRAYANSLLAKLSWGQYLRVIMWMATGYRKDAIKIIAGNVMIERRLVGLGTDSLDVCTAEVREFFTVLADLEGDEGVLVHCTQGKDRTGLTILLVLMLCGVDLQAGERDYMMSQEELQIEREERVAEIASIGLPEWFADCDPEFVREVTRHVEERYGGIERYLEGCRVDGEMREKVRRMLLA